MKEGMSIRRAVGRYPPLPMSIEITQPLYDYRNIGQNECRELNFFEFPMGANGKTEADTNMHHHGTMPAGVSHLVTGIRFIFIPDYPEQRMNRRRDERDARRYLTHGLLELRVGCRTYLRDGPLWKFPPCFPTYDKDPQFLARGLRKTRLIRLASQAYYSIVPLILTDRHTFGVQLSHLCNWIDAPARIGVILDGRRILPQ